jgi:glutaredoxin
MKLYICWGTFPSPRPGGHPCANAYHALKDAGHDFEVEKVHGLGIGPKLFQHKTEGRKEVERLSGSPTVPILVLDDGEVIDGSDNIVAWAEKNPATASATAAA